MKLMVAGIVVGACLSSVALKAQDAAPEPGPVPPAGTRSGMHEGKRMPTNRPGFEGSMRGPGMAMGGASEIMAERIVNDSEAAAKLGLSQEQITTIKSKLFTLRQSEVKLNADMELAAMEQAKLMTADKVSEAEALAAVEKVGNLRTQVAKLHVQKMLVLKQTLTADQMKKIKEVIKSRSKERKDAEPRESSENVRSGEKHQKRTDHGKSVDKKSGPEAKGPEEGGNAGADGAPQN
ncbi:MAG: hypothetical protein WCN95_07385 [bacterium]